jgi:type IV pilus biogenesis protein CpaD/CtpE
MVVLDTDFKRRPVVTSGKTAFGSVLASLIVVALASGCATEPSGVEEDFGTSVRQMIRAQTYDPSTLENPSREPVTGLDGEYAEAVVDAYKGDIAKPEQVRNEIEINVGNQ